MGGRILHPPLNHYGTTGAVKGKHDGTTSEEATIINADEEFAGTFARKARLCI